MERLRDHPRPGRDIEHPVGGARIDRIDDHATPPRILAEREDRRDAIVRRRDPGEDAVRVSRGHRARPAVGQLRATAGSSCRHAGSRRASHCRDHLPRPASRSGGRAQPLGDRGCASSSVVPVADCRLLPPATMATSGARRLPSLSRRNRDRRRGPVRAAALDRRVRGDHSTHYGPTHWPVLPGAPKDDAARSPCGRTPRAGGAKPPTEPRRTDPDRGDL